MRGRHHPRPSLQAVWLLRSQPNDTPELEVHLHDLLDRLVGRETALSEMAALWEIDFFCFASSDNGQGGLWFSPRLFARLAALPADLGIDLYLAPEDDA